MNFYKLNLELIKALRGKKSQNEISTKLKYEFNQYHRWESGSKKFYLNDFIAVCKVLKIDLKEIFRNHFLYSGAMTSRALIKHILKDEDLKEVSKEIKTSVKKIKDFLSGEKDPSFELFLNMNYHYMGMSFFRLLDSLVDPRLLPELAEHNIKTNEYFQAMMKMPYLFGLPTCVELKEYVDLKKHKRGVIARMLGITEEEEDKALAELERLEMIEKDKDGKWVTRYTSYMMVSNTRFDPRKIKKYWMERAVHNMLKYPTAPPEFKSRTSVTMLFLNDEGLKKLEENTSKYLANVGQIVKSSTEEERHVRILNLNIFDPGDRE